MSQSLLLSRTLPVILISMLAACGSGSDTGTPVGNNPGASSSSGSSTSSSGTASSSSSSSGSSSSSSGAAQTPPSTLKVVGGLPVEQFSCGIASSTLRVSNKIASATWLDCQGGLGAKIDVNPNQSEVRIVYGNAADGFVTFKSAPGSVSSTVIDETGSVFTIKSEKMTSEVAVGTRGTALSVPPQISVNGILKVQ